MTNGTFSVEKNRKIGKNKVSQQVAENIKISQKGEKIRQT